MINLQEIFEKLNTIDEEELSRIHVEVIVEKNYLNEDKLPSGDKSVKYDEQTLEDWYDFASTVEGIVDNLSDIVNISLSKNPDSLSEYIDFYIYDAEGNRKNYLIDLRLSDHGQTNNARSNRKRKVAKIDSNYILKSIIVNDKIYHSYSQAIQAVRELLAKEII